MNNDLTTISTPAQVTMLDIRRDCKTYPRLKTYKREQAVAEMSKIVTQAYLYKGQSADPANVAFIASTLVDELMNGNGLGTENITFAEIARIVKRAVLRDDMYGISVATIYKAIIGYVEGEGHLISIRAREMAQEEERQSIKDSVVAPMLQACAGAMMRKNKMNK